ncbi:ATP-NAD kinase-like domain-containing protein [Armillaria borealis]|uniref:ATP-NAD kinase-like domain-containing protein n=1 Tax=Armillaria borealis TaxID=47425 RepID=A0AA39ML67_9AGAR|nr:ATP-NAD kinase-like domain-containing protein [Armillaria borealis]
MSPDTDTFSTPPTSPFDSVRPSLSRKSSRPSSLRLDSTRTEWPNNIVLETSGAANGHILTGNETMTPTSAAPSYFRMDTQSVPGSNGIPRQPLHSPCFVHSHLDKGASLSEWLRNKQTALIPEVGVAHSLQRNGINGSDHQISSPSSASSSVISSSNDEDDYGASLTKQLAETAVGVREMSKQLGRARVRSNIQNVLIITKARDNRLIKLTRELALYLMLKPRNGQQRGLVVYVDNQLRHSRRFDAESIERDHPELFVPFPRRRTSSSTSLSSLASAQPKEELYHKEEGQLRYWTSQMCSQSPHLFDFVVTLGGDGTVLFTSWLFQRIVPPVLPFALGSLGFLTNFDFADHQAVMDSVLDSGIRVNLRMRFTCTVYRAVTNENKLRKAVKKGETGEIMMRNVEKDGWEAVEGSWSGGIAYNEGCKNLKDKEIMCFTTRPVETFEVLNDLVVDRGPSPFVSLLELFGIVTPFIIGLLYSTHVLIGDEHHMTTVQADGLTVSTPTGSTAYSLSAGGSLVHPEIPAILITPICPHTLSFRPMLLPDSMELRICVPFNSRSTAWASFDGRGRVELKQGDHIKVTASKYPFPTVCADKQSTDWFHAISRTLKWNERERQKSFVMVEEGPTKPSKRNKHKNGLSVVSGTVTPEVVEEEIVGEEEDEVSDEERDDGKFDIDDSSPEAAMAKASGSETIGHEKARETVVQDLLHKALAGPAASALQKEHKRQKSRSHSRSRARSRSGYQSGVQTPGRYAGPEPHPPVISPRRVEFSVHDSASYPDSADSDSGHRGTRDDIHSSRRSSGKSRIPKDRDLDTEVVQTPTAGNSPYSRGHSRSRSRDASGPRAFAVWGQDESDSTTSDSET